MVSYIQDMSSLLCSKPYIAAPMSMKKGAQCLNELIPYE